MCETTEWYNLMTTPSLIEESSCTKKVKGQILQWWPPTISLYWNEIILLLFIHIWLEEYPLSPLTLNDAWAGSVLAQIRRIPQPLSRNVKGFPTKTRAQGESGTDYTATRNTETPSGTRPCSQLHWRDSLRKGKAARWVLIARKPLGRWVSLAPSTLESSTVIEDVEKLPKNISTDSAMTVSQVSDYNLY